MDNDKTCMTSRMKNHYFSVTPGVTLTKRCEIDVPI